MFKDELNMGLLLLAWAEKTDTVEIDSLVKRKFLVQ